jgi:hypothetical protein
MAGNKITGAPPPKSGGDGELKSGRTKEALIAKKASGIEWTQSEQEAWDIMDEREKQIANETMKVLAGNSDFIDEKDPRKRENMASQILGTFQKVFGRKKVREGSSVTGKPKLNPDEAKQRLRDMGYEVP